MGLKVVFYQVLGFLGYCTIFYFYFVFKHHYNIVFNTDVSIMYNTLIVNSYTRSTPTVTICGNASLLLYNALDTTTFFSWKTSGATSSRRPRRSRAVSPRRMRGLALYSANLPVLVESTSIPDIVSRFVSALFLKIVKNCQKIKLKCQKNHSGIFLCSGV